MFNVTFRFEEFVGSRCFCCSLTFRGVDVPVYVVREVGSWFRVVSGVGFWGWLICLLPFWVLCEVGCWGMLEFATLIVRFFVSMGACTMCDLVWLFELVRLMYV